jgi:hypothetical protein
MLLEITHAKCRTHVGCVGHRLDQSFDDACGV